MDIFFLLYQNYLRQINILYTCIGIIDLRIIPSILGHGISCAECAYFDFYKFLMLTLVCLGKF